MDQTRFIVRTKDGRIATQDTEWVEPFDQLVASGEIEFGWVDLQAPYAVDLEDLQSKFGFHPHAIDDCRRFDQRAKLEAFSGHWFWVFHGSSTDESGEIRFSELHAFLTPRWLVTVHQGAIEGLDRLFAQWSSPVSAVTTRSFSALTPPRAWSGVMDALVDQHAQSLSALAEKLEALDEEIATRLHPGQIDRIHHLKMSLKSMRRLLSPQVDYLRAVVEGRMPVSESPEALLDFRAVKDHAQLLVEKLDLTIEATLSLRDSYAVAASLASNRMIGRLTAFSVIFLPLQFVTGFFGMNFVHIPYGDWRVLLGVLAFSILAPAGVLYWIRTGTPWITTK